MPFSGPSDPTLPSNVEGLSLEKRRQWVGAWNGRFEDCRADGGSVDTCESSAFAVANSAIKELDMGDNPEVKVTAKSHYGMEIWDLLDRQINQDDAEYSTLGGTDTQACANCRWFVNPDGCLIVEGWPKPILATGLSNRFELAPEPRAEVTPIPVTIVGDEGSSGTSHDDDSEDAKESPKTEITLTVPARLANAVKRQLEGFMAKVLKPDPAPEKTDQPFHLFKDADGNLRWFMWASNNYYDRDNPPEVFTAEAHKEFVGYLDDGGVMPEAWLWHTPGSRWGVADWVDYADGFLMYSGTVDPGMEAIAYSLEASKGIGVSHGYRYKYSSVGDGIIGWYRDFEVSTLPMEKAANAWTGIEILAKEIEEMGMTDDKRAFLVKHLGATKVGELEGKTEEMVKALDNLGIAWKDVPDADMDTSSADADADAKAKDPIDYAKLAAAVGETAVKALEESKAFKTVSDGVIDLSTRLAAVEEDVKGLKETDDAKIAGKFKAKAAPVNGHRASDDDANVLTKAKADDALKTRAPLIDPAFANSFLGPGVAVDDPE